MILSDTEIAATKLVVGHNLEGIITNRGCYYPKENYLMTSDLALCVRDTEDKRKFHYLILEGKEYSTHYFGDCARVRLKYLMDESGLKPLGQRTVYQGAKLDSRFSFSISIEPLRINAVRFYGHQYVGKIKDILPYITESELKGEHTFTSELKDYSLNIIELVHDDRSTIIRVQDGGFNVFLDQENAEDFMLDMNNERYTVLLKL